MKPRFSLYDIKLKYLFVLLAFTAIVTNVVLQAYYYVNFDLITKNKADAYFSSILEQVQGRVEATQKEIQSKSNEIAYSRLLQEYLNASDPSKKAEYFPLVVDYVSNVIHSSGYMKSIRILESPDQYIGTNTADEYAAVANDIFKAIGAESLFDRDKPQKKPVFMGPYLDEDRSSYYYAYVEPIFKTMSGDFSFDPIAFEVFICSVDNLQVLVDSIPISHRSNLVFGFNDTIVSANRPALIGRSLSGEFKPELADLSKNGDHSDKSRKQLLKMIEMTDNKWKIFLSIPIADITTDTAGLKSKGLVISIAEMLFFLVAGFLLIRVIYRQISALLADISKARRSEAGYRLRVRGTNEVGIISQQLNIMLGTIEEANETLFETRERLYATEIAKKQSEVNALHSQINPHFLYNTLECIRSIAKYRQVDEIAHISSSMADIFRYSIKADDFVSIGEELGILKSYFLIMNIRFQERFTFEIIVGDERLLDCQAIKMLLQPVVENAFYHGLEQTYGEGKVTVAIGTEGERIIIRVEDTGAGMPEGRLAEVRRKLEGAGNREKAAPGGKRSIGLENIAQRIDLIYGPDFGLAIDSKKNEGTLVTIEIPKIRHANAEMRPSLTEVPSANMKS